MVNTVHTPRPSIMPADAGDYEKFGSFQMPHRGMRRVNESLRPRRFVRFAVIILASIALFTYWSYRRDWNLPSGWKPKASSSLPCYNLPGAEDVVVVMKTGVTQIEDKLPAHLETTMRCYPNSVIWSDHEEVFQGWQIRDVLKNVDPIWQMEHDDFALYRHVKAVGREGLDLGSLTGTSSSRTISPDQKHSIGGWVLDKWKFLPMLNETYYLYPNHKWYAFVETDTYMYWSTILKYLETMDHTDPLFVGCQATDKNIFAQGGSGYVVSNKALKMFVDYVASNSTELDLFVESKWAGDYVLGVVFDQAGVQLTPAWPIFQAFYFGILSFDLVHNDKRFWCYPAGSFHHMTPEAVEDMWLFEQDWIRDENVKGDVETHLRFSDIFNDFMLPRMRFRQTDWDNQCTIVMEGVSSLEECSAVCLADHTCLQWMFDTDLQVCKTMDSPRLGEADLGSGIVSDWMFERIEQWRDEQPTCHGETFISPDEAFT